MTTENILLAIEEKRKWERRLDAVASELAALNQRRKDIVRELHALRDERSRLLSELGEAYEFDPSTIAVKHGGGPGGMEQR